MSAATAVSAAAARAKAALLTSMVLNGDEIRQRHNQELAMPDPITRTLTDADIEALAEKMIAKFEDRMYRNIGKTVWARFQQAVILVILGVAAAGYFKGWRP